MDEDHREHAELLGWLDDQQPAMTDLLETIVNIDSNSHDHAGVDRVMDALQSFLTGHGLQTSRIPQAGAASCLRADLDTDRKGRALDKAEDGHVLLLGHADTVFPTGETMARPFRIEGDRAHGPGVADMKAGLVMNVFVLLAFHRFGGNRHPIAFLCTTDEEIGSPASASVIEAQARGARAVFNAEPGRPNGNVVTARKGAWFSTLETTGKAAHSGVAHGEGASAIEALCRKVQALHEMSDEASGTTVNVGLIRGGQSVNTVAPHAAAEVDVRFRTLADLEAARAALQRIVATPENQGTRASLTKETVFLPLEPTPSNKALFDLYAAKAATLGLDVGGEVTGGSSDAGFTSAMGVPTLCATGPIGAHAHRPDEVAFLESFGPRAKTLALILLDLP